MKGLQHLSEVQVQPFKMSPFKPKSRDERTEASASTAEGDSNEDDTRSVISEDSGSSDYDEIDAALDSMIFNKPTLDAHSVQKLATVASQDPIEGASAPIQSTVTIQRLSDLISKIKGKNRDATPSLIANVTEESGNEAIMPDKGLADKKAPGFLESIHSILLLKKNLDQRPTQVCKEALKAALASPSLETDKHLEDAMPLRVRPACEPQPCGVCKADECALQ